MTAIIRSGPNSTLGSYVTKLRFLPQKKKGKMTNNHDDGSVKLVSSAVAALWFSGGQLLETSRYRVVPGDRNWHIETADWNLAGFFTIFRNLLAGIWGSFLRFIETGFRNWLAAFLGFSYDFLWFLWFFCDFPKIFLSFFFDFYLRVEFLLKTESGYLRDAEVTWFTLANP